MKVSDAELIARVLSCNDHHAFHTLVRLYQSPVRQFLRRLVQNQQDADELAQECFLIAFRRLESFRGEHFLAWLMTIAYRLGLKHLQRCKSMPQAALNETEAKIVLSETLRLDLAKALATLNDAERQALLASVTSGYSHQEIAARSEMPLGSVKSLIYRAKAKLRTLLRQWQYGIDHEG